VVLLITSVVCVTGATGTREAARLRAHNKNPMLNTAAAINGNPRT
jgi:hypothetical protein